MMRFFYVAAGGAVGTVFRYLVSLAANQGLPGILPCGTLIANLAGSLMIGLLWGVCESAAVSETVLLFMFVGVLGAFTTFSTFSMENFGLLRDGEYGFFFVNIFLNVVLGLGLTVGGYFLSRAVVNILK